MPDKKNQNQTTSNDENEKEPLDLTTEELKRQAEEYLNGWKRAKADYLNLQREMAREKLEWIEFSNFNFVQKLLPVLDSFQMLMPHIDQESEAGKGLLLVGQQIKNFLKEIGLEKIKTIGEKFDPSRHEAIEKRVSEEGETEENNNSIVKEEIMAGYLLNGKLIRPAKVIIE